MAVLPLLSCDPVSVLGVRPFGLCRDQAALEHWCQERNVPFIIDAAAALGGVLPDGRPVGGQGAMETFSLHATKVFAIGEGGAIAYMPQWQTPLREVLNFGMHDGTPSRMGINGKLSEFAAAVGLAQDDVFDEHLRVRRAVAERYRRFFMEHWSDWTPPWNPGSPPWQVYPVLAPTPEVLQRILQATSARGIQLRRYYHPALHQSPFGASYSPKPLPVSADLSARMLCFPVYSDLSMEDHFKIINVLKSIT